MSSVSYVSTVENLSKIGDILTIFINSILIFITHYHIQTITDAYKIQIILFASLGIVFSILESFIHPFMHSYNSSFNYFTTSPVFGASKPIKTALLLLWSCLYAVFICLIAIQFFYRFLLISGSRNIKIFTGNRVFWLFLYVFLGVIIWILSICQGTSDDFSDGYLREEMLKEYAWDIKQVPGFFMIVYEPSSPDDVIVRHLRPSALLYVGGVSVFLLSQYSVILYCSLQIQKTLSCLTRSPETLRLQKQIFRTMVFQTLTPSVFHHLPIFLVYLLCFFDMEISFPSGLMIGCFSFFPVADSLILMSLVGEYRKAVKKLFFGWMH